MAVAPAAAVATEALHCWFMLMRGQSGLGFAASCGVCKLDKFGGCNTCRSSDHQYLGSLCCLNSTEVRLF